MVYFRDVIGALFKYKACYEAKVRDNFQLTAIGQKIWETLDYALTSRSMVVLDGLEGRGKTEAVKSWCQLHLGTARFVSLKGITNKTTAFREIAKALGIASTYTRTAPQMQARIEDVLKRSKLMLVVDEAHFVFNQSRRMYSRPELVDWIDTAICNCGVPVGLVTTPQFIVCMTRAADQVEWNYRQFRRRVKRWVKLPLTNTEEDIKAVARNVFKKADAQTISKIAGYALLSKRDLSAVGDVAAEVRVMLGTEDLSNATVNHVHRAIYDFLLPSDKTFLEGMEAARNIGRKSIRKPTRQLPDDPALEPEEISSAHPSGSLTLPGSRVRAGVEASLIEA
ncbi:MAG: ATP-binding protein [Verrucomicrobiota bacterium]